MSKEIKVLFLVNNLRVSNGITSFVMTYFQHINHNKIKVDFALNNNVPTPYYKEIVKYGGKIFILPNIKHIRQYVKKCKKILHKNNYQIIHSNVLLASIPMMYCAYRFDVPVRILQSHNTRLSSTKWKAKITQLFLPLLKKLSTNYFACGNDAGKALFGNDKFNVIPNAISTKKIHFDKTIRKKVREKYNCQNKIIIGTVGRVSLQKNPFFALDVINLAHTYDPKIEYWWIGSGELDTKVMEYIKSNKMSRFVKLFGSCNDVEKLYQAMDAFFLPSLFEGLPIVAIESQTVGLPSVLSNSITKEVQFTDLVDYIPLSDNKSTWAKAIIEQAKRHVDRSKYSNDLRNSIFFAPKNAQMLTREYKKILKENVNHK